MASKLALVLLLLVAATVGATLLIIHDLWFYGILTAAVACLLLGGVFRLYRSNTRKITFMFNAIENNDYAFQFTRYGSSLSDDLFNRSLNRIKELLVKAKNEAIEREKYYELILERIITGIVVVNERGSVMQTNSEALRLLGLSVFTHLSQLDRVEEGLTEKFRALEVGEGTRVTLHHERGEVNLALQASEVTIRGTRLRIIAVNDIDRELDDKELESWIRLTRVLTHEIMNAVTPVMSLSDTLLRLHGNRDDDTYRGLEAIHATSKSLISFVESYRSFTRIPAPEMELLDVRKFLERIVMLVSRQIEEQHIRVDIRVEPRRFDPLCRWQPDYAGDPEPVEKCRRCDRYARRRCDRAFGFLQRRGACDRRCGQQRRTDFGRGVPAYFRTLLYHEGAWLGHRPERFAADHAPAPRQPQVAAFDAPGDAVPAGVPLM